MPAGCFVALFAFPLAASLVAAGQPHEAASDAVASDAQASRKRASAALRDLPARRAAMPSCASSRGAIGPRAPSPDTPVARPSSTLCSTVGCAGRWIGGRRGRLGVG